VHPFDVLGDPRRRRIVELLGDGEQSSGAITDVVRAEFGISQPAVSQHLRVLRENGFASVRADGARRIYAVEAAPLSEVDARLAPFRRLWEQRLDAWGTELARGRRAAREVEVRVTPGPGGGDTELALVHAASVGEPLFPTYGPGAGGVDRDRPAAPAGGSDGG
jgi:DNA-binding transcriptional ArsR family regulator